MYQPGSSPCADIDAEEKNQIFSPSSTPFNRNQFDSQAIAESFTLSWEDEAVWVRVRAWWTSKWVGAVTKDNNKMFFFGIYFWQSLLVKILLIRWCTVKARRELPMPTRYIQSARGESSAAKAPLVPPSALVKPMSTWFTAATRFQHLSTRLRLGQFYDIK